MTATEPAGVPAVPVHRLQALIDTWEASHTDWCCSRGCSTPDGKHLDDVTTAKLLADSFGFNGVMPLIDCPGTCTCGVGPYIDALRAAMHEEEDR